MDAIYPTKRMARGKALLTRRATALYCGRLGQWFPSRAESVASPPSGMYTARRAAAKTHTGRRIFRRQPSRQSSHGLASCLACPSRLASTPRLYERRPSRARRRTRPRRLLAHHERARRLLLGLKLAILALPHIDPIAHRAHHVRSRLLGAIAPHV
ncbi:uncharacterized protein BKA78DRAFT_310714 [Phyllosticta capitalensis]|uniref:uncharacterized protein n=1 Tax=Phyllosticta capitalensis TaxID=121624 RepID=UPI0031300C7E